MNSADPSFVVIAISGESESGKSTAGRFFERDGWARLKIADFYRAIFEAERPDMPFAEWSITMDRQSPEWICGEFVRRLGERLRDLGCDRCTLESLYGDALARGLKQRLGSKFTVIYLDVPEPLRLVRQMGREALDNVSAAEALMRPRDEMKREWGVLKVRAMADAIVDNSGTPAELERQLIDIAQRALRAL